MNVYFNQVKCGHPADLGRQVAFLEKTFPSVGDDCDNVPNVAFCYRNSIAACMHAACLWHFGFHANVPPKDILERGVELSRKYFAVIAPELKSGSQESQWFVPYSRALLLTTLAGHTKQRSRLSEHLHANLVVEELAIPVDPVFGDFLLCVASSFQATPMDISSAEERLRKTRQRRPKQLLQAWNALQSGDRKGFVAAVEASTKAFAKSAEDDTPVTAVAVLESILTGLAYEQGWTDLNFELSVAARLVTHSSLGFGGDQQG